MMWLDKINQSKQTLLNFLENFKLAQENKNKLQQEETYEPIFETKRKATPSPLRPNENAYNSAVQRL